MLHQQCSATLWGVGIKKTLSLKWINYKKGQQENLKLANKTRNFL